MGRSASLAARKSTLNVSGYSKLVRGAACLAAIPAHHQPPPEGAAGGRGIIGSRRGGASGSTTGSSGCPGARGRVARQQVEDALASAPRSTRPTGSPTPSASCCSGRPSGLPTAGEPRHRGPWLTGSGAARTASLRLSGRSPVLPVFPRHGSGYWPGLTRGATTLRSASDLLERVSIDTLIHNL
jgi:hypothetical protein